MKLNFVYSSELNKYTTSQFKIERNNFIKCMNKYGIHVTFMNIELMIFRMLLYKMHVNTINV